MKSLGRYVLMEEIGRGSMGTVHRASDPLIERQVALKTVDLGRLDDGSLEPRLRFLREAKAAGRLTHPGIVIVHDVGELEDVAFIVMELVEGRSLKHVLDHGEKIPLEAALELVRQAAEALAYAHRHGVVHRDVKPGNLLLTREGRVKITDFGIARVDQGARTRTGILVGSPRYMSPEQLSAQPLDGRSDVFSLGAMLYEIVTGLGPFDADRPEDVFTLMQNISTRRQRSARAVRPELPAEVDAIIERALQKDPAARYATGDDMAAALREALKVLGGTAAGAGALARLGRTVDGLMPEFDLFADGAGPRPAATTISQVAPPRDAAARQSANGGLLARLRREAEAMEDAPAGDDEDTQALMRRFEVERRMRAAFAFYQELVRYLGIVKPEIACDYALDGIGRLRPTEGGRRLRRSAPAPPRRPPVDRHGAAHHRRRLAHDAADQRRPRRPAGPHGSPEQRGAAPRERGAGRRRERGVHPGRDHCVRAHHGRPRARPHRIPVPQRRPVRHQQLRGRRARRRRVVFEEFANFVLGMPNRFVAITQAYA